MDTISDSSHTFDLPLDKKRALLAELLQKKASKAKYVPLSFAQQRLWFLNQLAPDSPFYNVCCTITLTGILQKTALEQSLNELVRRHEVLRTHFVLREGQPVQRIVPILQILLPFKDLTTLPVTERETEIQRLTREEVRHPFDLSKGPLLRAHLLQVSAEKHVLLLSMHHIISDGWSMGVLFHELGTIYAAFSNGRSSPLPELPVQYADYTRWQREWLTQEVLNEQMAYWKAQLANLPQLILPTDHPRPALQSFAGAYEAFHLDAETTTQLKNLIQQEGGTLFMALLAGFSVLLSRYSEQEDIVVGTGIANRTRNELENLIGFFVNTLVLRTNLSGDPTVRELLRRVREVALDAYTHQDVPFEQLVEELHPHRAPGQNPLFQAMLALQNAPYEPLELAGLKLHLALAQSGATKFDIYLSLWESAGELSGLAEYSADLFDASTIRRMLGHYRQLLTTMAAHPDARLSTLQMLTEPENEQLRTWNATGTDYPRDTCVYELFEQQVKRTPDATALCFANEALTYDQLNSQANQLAYTLLASGIQAGNLVGLYMERSPELIISMLAILKVGAAYVPLDLAYPQERVALMIEDTQMKVLLTQSTLLDQLSLQTQRVSILCLDREWESISRQETKNPACHLSTSALAYIIYTSGSTGMPKGVMVSHLAINRLVLNTDYIQIVSSDRIAQASNTAFDAATFEVWGALLNGAQLIGVSRDTMLAPQDFAQYLQQEQISILFLTTALLNQVAEAVPDAFRSLRYLLFGGEAVTPRWVRTILRHGKPEHLLHVYGPTENTTFSTWYPVEAVSEEVTTIPIGTPIANTTAHVLDRNMQPAPIGVAGELYLGGDGLATGYLRRPDITAERFVPDPFIEGAEEGERLYKTGDLVRYLPDGAIEFLQRLDRQVKLRGFRVELGEIESVLNQHPGVRESVVSLHEDSSGQKRLVGYVVPDLSQLETQSREADESVSHEHVTNWQMIFDDRIYGQSVAPPDPTFHIVGWNSTATGLPFPTQDMQTWLDDTILAIRDLHPRRVLEIGCGTGLVLFRVAPYCQQYHGTDISSTSLTYLHQQLSKPEYALPQVSLSQRPADDFSGLEPGSFDTIILNSVVQYFPDVSYLLRVLENALHLLAPGGHIFVGDVRSLPLLEVFHTEVVLEQAPASLSLEQIRQRVQQRVQAEEELVVDPAFFTRMAQVYADISQVRILPKSGRYINELSQFRYQAILRRKDIHDTPSTFDCPWLEWQEMGMSLESLRHILEQQTPPVLGLAHVHNDRLASILHAKQLLTAGKLSNVALLNARMLRDVAQSSYAGGIEPEDIRELGAALSYDVAISWARHASDGSYDVLLRRREGSGEAGYDFAFQTAGAFPIKNDEDNSWSAYANWPSRSSLAQQMLSQLRSYLQERLPDYMIPAAFIALEQLPLTPNGKLNREALPDPDSARPELEEVYIAPRNHIEELLAGIWAEVLGLNLVGINDNFFDLGGHSLLATQVIIRVRETFQYDVPLRTLFEYPTVAGLAQVLQESQVEQKAVLPPLLPQSHPDRLPLSFAQERLWFLAQLENEAPAYIMAMAFVCTGPLQVKVLEQSFSELMRRHEVLRTRFVLRDERPVQVIEVAHDFSLPLTDLSILPRNEREIEVRRLATEEARQSFDLSQGPLIRGRLVRMEEQKYILLLSLHHIIADGWSLDVFFRELSTIYTAFNSQRPSSLRNLPVQYADYALWQRQWLSNDVLQEQLDYWKQQLADLPHLILPGDHQHPARQQFRGRYFRFRLSLELTEALKKLSQREGVTLFMVLLTGFYALLSRYSGQENFAVGTPVANRAHSKLEHLIGIFVNTLVLRADLSGDPGVRTLLGRVRQMTLEAYAHQDLPFAKLVEALNPERSLKLNPLFQVMFALQNAPASPLLLPGIQVDPLEIEDSIAHFELMLNLYDKPDGLEGEIEYDLDLFEENTIRRLVAHYERLLTGMVSHPEQRLSLLPMLTEAEQEQLRAWNAPSTVYFHDACLHELFEQQVMQTPDAVAMVYGQAYISYAELNGRANQLAAYLRKLGVGPEVRVGICVQRSLEMVIGLLAILKAGGAYVPLDLAYPSERLSFMLEDSQARLLITQSHVLEKLTLTRQNTPVLCLDTAWQTIATESAENLPIHSHSQNLAYVIYTSGSTGKPKGVAIEHISAASLLYWARETYTDQERSGMLASTSICFDLSVFELFVPLSWGGSIVLCENVLQLPELYAAHNVTLINTVPSAAAELVRMQSIPRSVQTVNLAGEALSNALAQQLYQSSQTKRVMNLYGPSEDTTYSTWALIERNDSVAPPIGRPLPGKEVYVLDARRQRVPVGIPGELYISGVGVARGYLNRPELTADRFIPHPFSNVPGARLYKTGDLVRYRSDGSLEFLGRLDSQIKLRGFRIELGEIEAIISQHPTVRETVVVLLEHISGDKRLMMYVVCHPGQQLTLSQMRQYLQSRLPDYMIPSSIVTLESMPHTPNGKVDRKALPHPDDESSPQQSSHEPFRTPLEEVIATIWESVLVPGRERISRHDNFFELGGHSLLATQVMARLRTMLNVELPLRSIFEAPTVAELTELVEQARRTRLHMEVPSIEPGPRGDNLPLSFAQQRLWFLDQWKPDNASYNLPLALCLDGPLDVEALKRSLEEIVQRHESLRTTFGLAEGLPVQLIHTMQEVDVPLTDLMGLPVAERHAAAREMAFAEAGRPFDLARGLLLRTRLLRLSENEHHLLLTTHHIISDGWSTSIFLRELATLYTAYTTGQPSPLAPLPVQYADVALWQRQWLQGELLESLLAYWKQQLHSIPDMLALPTDRPRPAVQTLRGSQLSWLLPTSLSESLTSLSRREGVTLFMTMLAAFDILLSRYSGQDDIVVGTPIANRTHSQLEDLIGFFVNTLVLRANLAGNPSFRQLLAQVKQLTIEAYAHQDLPFERLVEELEPERALSHTPLFQVMFALQNMPLADIALPGLTLTSLTVDSGTSRLDLTVVLQETERGLQIGVEYNTDLFDAATIARMMGHYQTLLMGIVADSEQRVWALPLLTEQECRQLQIWNDTQRTYPPAVTLHGLIETQAQQTPDAIAVSIADEQISYGELHRRATQIASLLRQECVGPERAVGICLERSVEMVVGLLGILQAGAIYVPLDPALPPERLRGMLDDAHITVVLTRHGLSERLPATVTRLLSLDGQWMWAKQESSAFHRQEPAFSSQSVQPEQVAYIIYTSGSTGRPKGVMVSHRSICNRLLWMQETYQLTKTDHVLQKTPLSFDVSVWEVFWPLLVGARLVLARPGGQQDSRYLVHLVQEQAISTLHFVPSMLSVFLQESGLEACRNVTRVICSGEALPFEVQEHFFERMGHQTTYLYNLYGPTEAAVDVTWWACQRTDERHIVPIGRPIANIDLYVLDRYGNQVPVGVAGELHIGGVGLARGYVGQADLTAERFIPHAFSSVPGARLYGTGDLVRYRANGVIEFLGRIDHQVKLRGFRIELEEIEMALSQHPDVQETVVVMREDADIGKYLIAYIIPQQKSEPSHSNLRGFLQERLPDYMIPAKFIMLEAFPLTANGKLDRRALPMPETTVSKLEEPFEEPQTELERVIAHVWQEFLHVENVGLNHNFFDLGGHSLLMFQVQKNLQEKHSIDITLVDLFTYPTVRSLAHFLGSRQHEEVTARIAPTRSQKRTELLRKQQQYRQMKG